MSSCYFIIRFHFIRHDFEHFYQCPLACRIIFDDKTTPGCNCFSFTTFAKSMARSSQGHSRSLFNNSCNLPLILRDWLWHGLTKRSPIRVVPKVCHSICPIINSRLAHCCDVKKLIDAMNVPVPTTARRTLPPRAKIQSGATESITASESI